MSTRSTKNLYNDDVHGTIASTTDGRIVFGPSGDEGGHMRIKGRWGDEFIAYHIKVKTKASMADKIAEAWNELEAHGYDHVKWTSEMTYEAHAIARKRNNPPQGGGTSKRSGGES